MPLTHRHNGRMGEYLCVIPDTVTMTREYFANLLKKYRYHKSISFGFSVKHTKDIMEYRRQLGLATNEGTTPSNLYSVPVEWNAAQTYVK